MCAHGNSEMPKSKSVQWNLASIGCATVDKWKSQGGYDHDGKSLLKCNFGVGLHFYQVPYPRVYPV